MFHATRDERLSVRVLSERPLVYSAIAGAGDDRPAHVRAASAIVVHGDRLFVIQDDTAFIAVVGDESTDSITLPRGPGGRRRFEVALGNKLDKLDLEAAVILGDELVAFGSGSLPVREKIVRVRGSAVTIEDAHELYARLRDAIGALNLEGATCVGDELWLFHRGNTGPADPGPAVARLDRSSYALRAIDRYDLGAAGGARFGFTDAAARGDRVFFLAAAEASPDAIEDGDVAGAMLGVIDRASVRFAPLFRRKVEGLAWKADRIAWITIDPDSADIPAPLCEVELVGPW